jgi:hypothetical protein
MDRSQSFSGSLGKPKAMNDMASFHNAPPSMKRVRYATGGMLSEPTTTAGAVCSTYSNYILLNQFPWVKSL